jgi:hypothetical protein
VVESCVACWAAERGPAAAEEAEYTDKRLDMAATEISASCGEFGALERNDGSLWSLVDAVLLQVDSLCVLKERLDRLSEAPRATDTQRRRAPGSYLRRSVVRR